MDRETEKEPTLNEKRKEYGLKPIKDGDVILTKEKSGSNRASDQD